MPTYVYHCKTCARDLEVFQSMRDDPLTQCPECAVPAPVTRKITAGAGIIFKGTGFYETDYKRAAPPASESATSTGDGASKAPAAGGPCACGAAQPGTCGAPGNN